VLVAATPFGATVTRFITLKKDTPFKATPDFIRRMIEEAEAQSDAPKREIMTYQETGMHMVGRAILEARLNGYPVQKFTGQEVKEVSLAEMIALVPDLLKQTLLEAEKNLLPHVPVEPHVYTFALFLVLREHYPHTPSFCIVDIHAHHSECTLVRDGLLIHHTLIPFGIGNAATVLAEKLGTLESEAFAHLKDAGSASQHGDVSPFIVSLIEEHAKKLRTCISELEAQFVLPKDCILISPRDYDAYTKAVATKAFLAPENSVEHVVHTLGDAELEAMVDRGENVSQYAPVTAILARFVHIERERGFEDSSKIEVY
jgi:hypothetical protein